MKKPMPDFLHHPLAREITLAVVIKLLVIAALFYAFFDGRTTPPDADSVADHVVNSQPHATH
jgi:hypothetical protein